VVLRSRAVLQGPESPPNQVPELLEEEELLLLDEDEVLELEDDALDEDEPFNKLGLVELKLDDVVAVSKLVGVAPPAPPESTYSRRPVLAPQPSNPKPHAPGTTNRRPSEGIITHP
jgi:hypothetical protein